MNERIYELKKWLRLRSVKEQVAILFFAMALTYFVWILLENYFIASSHQRIQKEIEARQVEIKTIQNQKAQINEIVNRKSFIDALKQKKSLSNLSSNFKQKIQNILPTVVSHDKIPALISDILKQQQGVAIVDLKKLPPEAWIPDNSISTELPVGAKNISRYGFQVEFHSSYFDAVDFLARLEKLPWRIYWDSLEYKVIEYPEGDIIIKFYVLGN